MIKHAINDLRPSPIAGRWYPGKQDELVSMIDRFVVASADTVLTGTLNGLIAPHAGYIYSGQTAAAAFKLVRGLTYRRVVVISPMHSYYDDPILTSGHEAYWTPLGAVPVDREMVEALGYHLPVTAVRRDPEHALEIELPFLQHLLGGPFLLIPLMLRDQTYATAWEVGTALATVLKDEEDTLLVASSDLSHFYTDAQARALDRIMLDQIAAFDAEKVIRVEDEGKAFACGRAAIAAVMIASKALGASQAKIVAYATSADASGDSTRVVGYGAAALFHHN